MVQNTDGTYAFKTARNYYISMRAGGQTTDIK